MGTRRKLRAWLSLASSIACALGSLVAGGGEPRKTIDVSRALDASQPGALPSDIVIGPAQPDPAPLTERAQWIFDLQWARGEVALLGVRRLELASAQATSRVIGRFALELFEGRTLLERERFDFPLLGAPEPDASLSLVRKLSTRTAVMFPAARRGTRLELLDRATNRRWPLPWPPRLSADASID
jgi:hypothetical protein